MCENLVYKLTIIFFKGTFKGKNFPPSSFVPYTTLRKFYQMPPLSTFPPSHCFENNNYSKPSVCTTLGRGHPSAVIHFPRQTKSANSSQHTAGAHTKMGGKCELLVPHMDKFNQEQENNILIVGPRNTSKCQI